jgi:hypothetical protein
MCPGTIHRGVSDYLRWREAVSLKEVFEVVGMLGGIGAFEVAGVLEEVGVLGEVEASGALLDESPPSGFLPDLPFVRLSIFRTLLDS